MRRILFVFVFFVFFFGGVEVHAFGHPDSTIPSIQFIKPDTGFPMNPKVPGSATISFEAEDTTVDDGDKKSEITSCSISTKNGDSGWTNRDSMSCAKFPVEFLVKNEWCNTEGTNTCGVRITACTTGTNCVRGERFFTIDYTPPVIEIGSNRGHPTQKIDAELTFRASDAYGVKNIKCVVDVPTEELKDCTSPKSYSRLPDGLRKFEVRAQDTAGNTGIKKLTWEIDSTPPSPVGTLVARASTYFSQILDWTAPDEDGANPKNLTSTQYDIRYSVAPITNANWNDTTALVYKEHEIVPPKNPGKDESMLVGPKDASALEEPRKIGHFSSSNLVTSNIFHHFALKTRDEKWNWSDVSNIAPSWTKRDPCDYDADRLYNPKRVCGPRVCDPSISRCDLYENPFDWSLPGDWPYDKPDDEWIRVFGATAADLDQDGEEVENERIGVNLVTKNGITGYPRQSGKDWYDNPFTLDLLSLNILPTLKQLSYTVSDLDLDTFVSRDWKKAVGLNEPSEPPETDLLLSAGKNKGGCVYPDAPEETCFNCTAYNPDVATGRIPSGKIEATVHKKRPVCQIEAYYTALKNQDPPYEVIKEMATGGGTIEPGKEIIAASAQCRDGLNNDLASGTDSSEDPKDPTREINCPTKFEISGTPKPTTQVVPRVKESVLTAALFPKVGLVQCGRHADDFVTPIDESADCGFCQLFVLFGNLINLIVSRLMPVLAALSLVAGGLLMVLSAGSAERFARGKDVIRWAFTAYAVTLLGWAVLTLLFSIFGIAKWTGFTPEKGDIKQLSESSLAVSSERWEKNEWKEYAVEVRSPKGEKVIRKIASNTSDTLVFEENQPFVMSAGEMYRYHILDTGWWNFVCGISPSVGADFAASPGSGIAPFAVDFTDLSEGEDIRSWSWDFGDGGRSSKQSPRHEYKTNGPHIARLTVEGPRGSDRATKTIHYAPTAEFSSSRVHGRTPLEVKLQDTSTGEISGWSWDLNGDEQEDSREQNPVYTYTSPGPYRAKLTVSGPGGRDTESKVNYIFAYPGPPEPVADFATSTLPDTLTEHFANLSFAPKNSTLDDITSWLWDFGDKKGISAVEEPDYFFGTRAEPYTVILKAIGPGGENTTSTSIAFSPGPNFTADKVSGVSPSLEVKFQDTSTGTVSGLTWGFGDGSKTQKTLLGESISHAYTKNGVYAVGLTGEGKWLKPNENVKNATKNKYIAVAPRADFSYKGVKLSDLSGPSDCTGASGCTVGPSGADVTFSNNSTCEGACTSYWEFGDGGAREVQGLSPVTYKYAGISEEYTVRLTVTGPGGGDTMEKKNFIHIAPFAKISPEKVTRTRTITYDCGVKVGDTGPVSIAFNDASEPRPYIKTRQWSTGDAGFSTIRSFENSGSVSLTVVNARGQSDNATASVEIKINTINIPCPPAKGGGGGA